MSKKEIKSTPRVCVDTIFSEISLSLVESSSSVYPPHFQKTEAFLNIHLLFTSVGSALPKPALSSALEKGEYACCVDVPMLNA